MHVHQLLNPLLFRKHIEVVIPSLPELPLGLLHRYGIFSAWIAFDG
jgi:hypothetical protein